MASPNLNITPVSAGQNNKEITINDADMALERAFNDVISLSLAGGNLAITVAQFTRHFVFRVHAALANTSVTIPHNVGAGDGTAKRVFALKNDTDFDVMVTTGRPGATNAILKKGISAILSSDGMNIITITAAGGVSGISLATYVPGETPPSLTMLRYASAVDFTLPAGLAGSVGSVGIYPDGGDVVFDLRLNGVSFGSMEFADGESEATFSLASPRVVEIGDVITVNSPSDTYGMGELSFTLLGV